MTKPKSISRTVVIVIAIMAVILGFWSFKRYQESRIKSLSELTATVISPPRALNPFTLHYGDHKTFTNADLQGQWSFVFFGYTRCPDICPTTMAVLNNTYTQIEKLKQPTPRVIFISVDPERDNGEYLQRYVQYFNAAFQGVTGTPEEIQALTKELGVVYLKVTPSGQAYTGQTPTYLVDHSGVILLFNPQGQLRGLFQMPHDPMTIAKEYAVIVAHQ